MAVTKLLATSGAQGLLAAGLLAWGSAAAAATEITAVRATGGTVEIVASAAPNFTTFTMTNPPRLVVDLADASFSGVPAETPVNRSDILSIKTLKYGTGPTAVARVMITYGRDLETDIITRGNNVLVKPAAPGSTVAEASLPPPAADAPVAIPAPPATENPPPPPSTAAPEVAANDAKSAPPPAAAPPPLAESELKPLAPLPPLVPAPDDTSTALAETAPAAGAGAPPPADPPPVKPSPPPSPKATPPPPAPRLAAVAPAAPPAPPVRARAPAAPTLAAAEQAPPPAASPAAPPAALEEQRAPETAAANEAPTAAPAENADLSSPAAPRAGGGARAVSSRRKVLSLVGLRFGAGPSVFVRTNEPVNYLIDDRADGVVLTIENTRIAHSNDARPIDAHYFDSPIATVRARQVRRNVEVRIQLKNKTPYQATQNGSEVELSFSRG